MNFFLEILHSALVKTIKELELLDPASGVLSVLLDFQPTDRPDGS
jgi:hypothetical protein